MLSNNLDIYKKNSKNMDNKSHHENDNDNDNDNNNDNDINNYDIKKLNINSNVLNANINVDSLDIHNIKRETYYKMKFIMNSLEKNKAIKKRKNIYYLKNLDDSMTEIITEEYLNKRIINKIYNTISNDNEKGMNDGYLGKNKMNDMILLNKKKEDIIPLKDGVHTLKMLIDKGKLDINLEQKNDIYLMIFLMNTLENGWSIRKRNDNYVFRKKHEKQKEVYTDEYLVHFLKSNMNNVI